MHRQIHPFNKSRVEPSRKAQSLQGSFEISLCPQAHHRRDSRQPAPPVAFFHLPVDQPRCYLPLAHFPSSPTHLKPLTKVGRERIEVEIEPITGKEWKTARDQNLSQSVDELMGHVLCVGTELKHRKNFRAGINGQPEHLGTAAEPCSQFIQLQVRELEVAEIVLV
jgi:hypothetical protein